MLVDLQRQCIIDLTLVSEGAMHGTIADGFYRTYVCERVI